MGVKVKKDAAAPKTVFPIGINDFAGPTHDQKLANLSIIVTFL